MDVKALINLMATPIEYGFDFLRACKWSKASPFCDKSKQLHYDILLLAHTVEKGLSVANPRTKFGKAKILKLLEYLHSYDENWGIFPMEKSYGCLKQYMEWHASIDVELDEIGTLIETYLDRCEKLKLSPKGGTKQLNNSDIALNENFENALNSRASCRRYLPKFIEPEIIDRIGKIATRTPSQCNRQSSRVHYYNTPSDIQQLLSLQGGAEGFKESVYNLFVISSEMSAWSGIKARSQAYVDGALTAMQVLNACQALGLGACPLNLAVTNSRERKICKAGNISKGERLIVMIAFGYPEDVDLKVARSERMAVDNVLCQH